MLCWLFLALFLWGVTVWVQYHVCKETKKPEPSQASPPDDVQLQQAKSMIERLSGQIVRLEDRLSTSESVSFLEKSGDMVPIIPTDGRTSSMIIGNSYENIPKYTLTSTVHDMCAISQAFLGSSDKLDTDQWDTLCSTNITNGRAGCMRNRTAGQMGQDMKAALKEATNLQRTCFLYFTMHGTGGNGMVEYLIGDDGSFFSERYIRKMLQDNKQVPLVVLIVDACNAGGLFHLKHTYTYDENGMRPSAQDSDGSAVIMEDANRGPPILALMAAREDQYAQATKKGSVFTTLLTQAKKQQKQIRLSKNSLHDTMTQVARKAKEITDIHSVLPMYPVVGFNDSFIKWVEKRAHKVFDAPHETLQSVYI